MFKYIFKPLLFSMSPEMAHNLIVRLLKIGSCVPGFGAILKSIFAVKHPCLEREVFGIKFKNPVGLAAGFDKNAEIFNSLGSMGFGFIEVGTITPNPQHGNPKPRLFRLIDDSALINRMGFNNLGVERAICSLKSRKKNSVVIGGNLGKNTLTPNENAPADYLKLFRRLYEHVNYFVINISCPNIANMGKLQTGDALRQIVEGLVDFRRGQTNYRPILIKISPDLSFEQIDDVISVMRECNLDGIVATNTTTSRANLLTPEATVEAIGNGGLSGKPLTSRSLEVIKYVAKKTSGRYPIIGVGGIMTEQDAINMLQAGASLIQIYSGFIYNGPAFTKRICKKLIELEAQK